MIKHDARSPMFKRFEVAVTYSAFGILSRNEAVMRAGYHGVMV